MFSGSLAVILLIFHCTYGKENLGFFSEIHQGGLPNFGWLGSDFERANRYEEPEYILIADAEEDHHQTNKMDYHHNPLGKVRKRHYDPVSYYKTENYEGQTSTLGPEHYEPLTYDDSQPHDGSHYVYDPYKYYQERSHRVQELSVPEDTFSDPDHRVPLLDAVYEEEGLAHDFDEHKETNQYNLDKHADHKVKHFYKAHTVQYNEGADEYFSADNLYTPLGKSQYPSEKQSLYENPKSKIYLKEHFSDRTDFNANNYKFQPEENYFDLGNIKEGLTKSNRRQQAEKTRNVEHGSTKENFEYVDLHNSKIPSFKETDLRFDISSFRPLSFATF